MKITKRMGMFLLNMLLPVLMMAQGWPANYQGVMLQGFYWDSYEDTKWTNLTAQADELSKYFDLIWIPNSGQTKEDQWNSAGNWGFENMGYMPVYWLKHNTCFGTEAELKTMINTFKAKGTGFIEDVVINHKNGLTNWADFPDESVTGSYGTYTIDWCDAPAESGYTTWSNIWGICKNDELFSNGGVHDGVTYTCDPSANYDEADNFDGCRDLDHTNATVQNNIKTYLDFLKNELGYMGFRYDMVKGYAGYYVGQYNKHAKPIFSVGEYWDSWDGVTSWVNNTTTDDVIQSAAFDFPLKFLINNAFNNGNWSALTTQGMAGADQYKRYSVTFVDNHDTYRDDNKMSNDNRVLAANAFILAMPGTPCIFLPHWKTHKENLKKMIAARKAAGISNQSSFTTWEVSGGRAFRVEGTNGNSVLVTLGYVTDEHVADGYKVVVSGDATNHDFCFYVNNSLNVDEENIPKANTGLESVETNTINVYVDTETKGSNLYVWDKNNSPLNGAWPGTALSTTEVACVNNKTWYVKRFNQEEVNVIVNWGQDQWQSSNMEGVTSDVFITYDGGNKTSLTDLTNTYAGYPEGWYEQGEVCALFEVPSGWESGWNGIKCYAFGTDGDYTAAWRGDECTYLGKNENGAGIWKWTCSSNKTGMPTKIVFNSATADNGNPGTNKTEDLTFTNGGWYSATSYIGSGNTSAVGGVTPTDEISLASMGGSDVTATNWNGESEHVRAATNAQTLSKTFRLAAGSYKVQAIVRGTANGEATLTANGQTDNVTLTGFEGSASTVSTSGLVEPFVTGTNNGWHKVEVTFSLNSAAQVPVTLTSTAANWQVGALKVLDSSVATKASTSVTQTNYNAVNVDQFSFFERGDNPNVLIHATSSQIAARLPYNIIVGTTCDNLKLTDGNYSFGANTDFTAGAVSYDRAFVENRKVTVCLPFAVTAAELAAMNAEAYEFTGVVNGSVKFTKVKEMTANTPYVFVSSSDQTPFASLSSRSIVATPNAMEVTRDGVTFTGTMTRQTLNDGTTHYYGYSGGEFVKVGSNVGINPFRAFLKTTASLNAKLQVVFDDTVDGIDLTTEPTGKQNSLYDLSGRQIVNGQSVHGQLPKGIYIVREGHGANAKTRKIIIK